MRQPPNIVPSAIAAWQASTTQNGTGNFAATSAVETRSAQTVPYRMTEMMPMTFCASFVPWL